MPEFLSDETVIEFNKLQNEANEILSQGKIEDVVYYFEKLNDEEKETCMKKLSSLINL